MVDLEWLGLILVDLQRFEEDHQELFNRPGVAGAVLQTALLLINSVSHSSVVEIFLRRRHALMVEDGVFRHKIDNFTIF